MIGPDPNNREHQELLARCHLDMGRIYSHLGDANKSLDSFQKNLAAVEALAKQDAENALYQDWLTATHRELGAILMDPLSRPGEALKSYNTSLEICTDRLQADPHNAAVGYSLGLNYKDVGRAYGRLDRVADAKLNFHLALETLERLAKADPVNTDAQRCLVRCYLDFSYFLRTVRQTAESQDCCRKASRIAGDLARTQSDWPELLELLGDCYQEMGKAQIDLLHWSEAQASLEEAVKIYKSLAEKNPRRREHFEDLVDCCYQLGGVHERLGRDVKQEKQGRFQHLALAKAWYTQCCDSFVLLHGPSTAVVCRGLGLPHLKGSIDRCGILTEELAKGKESTDPLPFSAPATEDQTNARRQDRLEEHDERMSHELERLLAQLRTAGTEKEKERLARAIVEFVREEIRGTWLQVDFILQALDLQNNTVRLTIAGTALMVDGLLLTKDTKVWVEGKERRLTDLQAGMQVSLQLAVESEQRLIVGIRAHRSGLRGPLAAAIDRLIRQLGSKESEERAAASKALEAIGKPALAALRRAVTSADAEVRGRAKRLIEAQLNKESFWYCTDPTQQCSVRELDGKLYLTNQGRHQTEAVVHLYRHKIEVIAFGWGDPKKGGLKGRLEIDKEGARIKWENNTKWTQTQF